MLEAGHWEATSESIDGLTAGFHLSSLYSPVGWLSWAECVQVYEKAKKDATLMQGFRNTILGETYEQESEAPEWQRLYETRENYPMGVVPRDGLFLTGGVDIQKNRIECEVVAWGRQKQSWSVDYYVLDGDTAKPEVWAKLADVVNKDYPHESGITMPIRVMCVDSGYATQDVYSFVRQFNQAVWGGNGARANAPRTVVAIKGQSRDTAMILSTSKADTKKKGLKVWNVSGPVIKTELYRWLKMERIGEDASQFGRCHFPAYAEEYFKQLTAERQIVKVTNGYPRSVWEKDPTRRNEALDCRVYARAGAAIYGLDRIFVSIKTKAQQILRTRLRQLQSGFFATMSLNDMSEKGLEPSSDFSLSTFENKMSIRELKSIVSEKEWQFVQLILDGYTNDEATAKAHVSKNVLENIRGKIRGKQKNKKF